MFPWRPVLAVEHEPSVRPMKGKAEDENKDENEDEGENEDENDGWQFLAPEAGRLLIATRRKPVDGRILWSRAPGAGRLKRSIAPLRGLSP